MDKVYLITLDNGESYGDSYINNLGFIAEEKSAIEIVDKLNDLMVALMECGYYAPEDQFSHYFKLKPGFRPKAWGIIREARKLHKTFAGNLYAHKWDANPNCGLLKGDILIGGKKYSYGYEEVDRF